MTRSATTQEANEVPVTFDSDGCALAGTVTDVAAQRHHKRGAGSSGGDCLSTGMGLRAADARAALAVLADRYPGPPLLTIGHSEGTYYAARLALPPAEPESGYPGVAGTALLSGSGRTGGHDLQVPPDHVAAIGDLVRGPFEGHVVGDLSHLLRPDPASIGPRGYKRATRLPVSQDVLSLVTGWAAKVGLAGSETAGLHP